MYFVLHVVFIVVSHLDLFMESTEGVKKLPNFNLNQSILKNEQMRTLSLVVS